MARIQSKHPQMASAVAQCWYEGSLYQDDGCWWRCCVIPSSGICRDVMGIFSEILSWNTVRDSSTVTPIIYENPIVIFMKPPRLPHQPILNS